MASMNKNRPRPALHEKGHVQRRLNISVLITYKFNITVAASTVRKI